MQTHSHVLEFLQGRIHQDWWVTDVVKWYCRSRRFDMPKGRCHFGEIAIFYAPAYFFLGVLSKIILGIGSGIVFATSPVWKSVAWFYKKVEADHKIHSSRFPVIGTTTVIIWLGSFLGLFIYSVVKDPDDRFAQLVVIPAFVGTLVLPFILGYLMVWVYEANAPRLQPAFELGREAASALRSPTVKQMVHAVTAPVRAVPTAIRHSEPTLKMAGQVAITPMRVVRVTFRAGRGVIRGSRDLGVILATLSKDGWRKICPLVTYVRHDGSSTSGRTSTS